MNLLAANNLVILMALARHKDDITLGGHHHGGADSLRAIGYAKGLSSSLHTLHNLVEDVLGVLGAGVVRSEDSHIGLARGYASHLLTFRGVAVATAATYHYKTCATTTYVVDRGNHILQRIGRMGIIDNSGDATLGADRLKTATHRVQCTQRLQHLAAVGTQLHRCAIDAEQVVGVEASEK